MTIPDTPQDHTPSHMLVITLNRDAIREAQAQGDVVLDTDPEFWDVTVRCDADRGDYTRECVTWWRCDCHLTREQYYELTETGDGPCPASPTGRHRVMPFTECPHAAHPSPDCWAHVCDDVHEAALWLADRGKLGPGEYPIYVHTAGDSDQSIEFELAQVMAR